MTGHSRSRTSLANKGGGKRFISGNGSPTKTLGKDRLDYRHVQKVEDGLLTRGEERHEIDERKHALPVMRAGKGNRELREKIQGNEMGKEPWLYDHLGRKRGAGGISHDEGPVDFKEKS